MGIQISGSGMYLPEKILTNFDLEKMVETNDEWIRTRTGIEKRHLASPEEATSDLAYHASLQALEMAGLKGSDLNAIVIATITPDHVFPCAACELQQKLGATGALCFDLSAACSGLLFSLEVVYSLMKANPDKYRNVLVLGAETLSSIVNWTDRNTCVLFGDGAGALVLTNDGKAETPDFLVASDVHSDGTYTEILKMPAGGSRKPASAETVAANEHSIHMAGREVFKLAVNAMIGSSRKVLENSGVELSQIKWLIPHQANMRIIEAIAQRLDIPAERVYHNIDHCGNTSAASIGICLAELAQNGQLEKGDYVLLTAFGGGLTWGAVLIRW